MKFSTVTRRATSVAAIALALALAGCSTQTVNSTPTSGASVIASANPTATGPSTSVLSADLAATIAAATHFDQDDLNWNAAKETKVSLSDTGSQASGTNASGVTVNGSTVTITTGGTYRLSGDLSNGSLVITAGAEDVVRLVLDTANITSSSGAAVNIQSANEVLIYLQDGTSNTLSDAKTYANTATDAPNAALYSRADLTVAGTGSLSVNGNYQDGIVSKDGLVLASGNVTVNAVDDGIIGKDYTVLLDGLFTVTAGDDGVKASNDTDADRGWLLLAGGTLSVAAGDDGIKAATTLTISGGTSTVSKSEEGLEAPHIVITGGAVTVTAKDDGVNAAGGSTTSSGGMGGGMGGGETVGDYSVEVSGGTLIINAEGDGLDSNGTASISGGTIVINGPTNNGNGALDVNGELIVSGGTVAAAGSAGMAVTPSASSPQSGVQITFTATIAAGTPIHLVDSAGTVVATFVTTKATQSLVFSSPNITAGAKYTIYTGGTGGSAGLGNGSITGATQLTAVTAGEYTAARGPGRK